MNDTGTAFMPMSRDVHSLVFRASCLVSLVSEICHQSDNPCEANALAEAGELLQEAQDILLKERMTAAPKFSAAPSENAD